MAQTPDSLRRAFRDLEGALTRRRIEAVDVVLRLELAALALLSAAFVFWQARVPLDGMVRKDGPLIYAVAVLASWVFLAALGAVLAGARMRRLARDAPEGPSWLALPIPPAALERHLSWNARARALPLLVPAAGLLAAGVGLVPWWWLAALAALGWLLLLAAARAGCAVALRLAAARAGRRAGRHPLAAALAARTHAARRRPLPPARWTGGAGWRAMVRKDLLLARRPTRARRLALAPLVFAVASVAAWSMPAELPLARFAAFGFSLVAAASLAEWLVALSGEDPFAVIRTLPVGLAEVWGARALWAVAMAAALIVSHALAAPLSDEALRLFLVWTGAATLCIGVLGVNYGVTLFPRADIASRMLALALGLAMVASIMIPLLGWVLLLAALIHSARRLGRWSTLEPA